MWYNKSVRLLPPDHPEYNCIDACVAQSVEQFIRNERVAGSNPVTSSNKKPLRIDIFGGFLCILTNPRGLHSQGTFMMQTLID